jgi:DNA (cytosine-5)-methyltransferase 3A
MNVLSLFDGISCARVALLRAGLPIRTYYASEIDPHAIAVSRKNFPDTHHLGDIRTLHNPPSDIDLLIGGSPCVDLSIAKKERKGLEGDHSSLFYEYLRVLRLVNPRFFILENVASMPSKDRDIITKEMGVEPVMIDASLVSAQCRKRLFWTNLPVPNLPADRGIVLKDILQSDTEVDPRMMTSSQKAFCLTSSYGKSGTTHSEYERNATHRKRTLIKIGSLGNDAQGNRVYSPDGKSATLSANGGGMGAKTGLYLVQDIGRRLDEHGHRKDGDTRYPIVRCLEVRDGDKSRTLTSVAKDNLIFRDHVIRKLTPIECERLQGLPDNYTEGIPITHRYRCLGNAFNVDVIVHILNECLG